MNGKCLKNAQSNSFFIKKFEIVFIKKRAAFYKYKYGEYALILFLC